jgi:hypothetical protein
VCHERLYISSDVLEVTGILREEPTILLVEFFSHGLIDEFCIVIEGSILIDSTRLKYLISRFVEAVWNESRHEGYHEI